MRLEDSIWINRSVPDVFAVASDLEGHAWLLPGYRQSRIVDRQGGRYLLQREAVINGRLRRWTSETWMESDRAIYFRQMQGPLQGMVVSWEFEPQQNGTCLRIIHQVRVSPRWKGWFMERWIARPAIERTARKVLEAIKAAMEKEAAP